jgi:hypothetical protein
MTAIRALAALKRGRSEVDFEIPANSQFIARACWDRRGYPRLVIGEKPCLTLRVAMKIEL